jgi:superfamily I DNA/RNA helicase
VRQTTVLELCVPKVAITDVDDPAAARAKGEVAMLEELELAAMLGIKPPTEDVVVPLGVRRLVFTNDEIGEWLDRAADGVVPFNQRRLRLRSIAQQELRRRTGDDVWPEAGPLRKALEAAWPTQQPIRLVDKLLPGPRGKRRRWTAADQLLIDEANSILNGPPLVYGHVVVDEAQDHSAVALRVIGRRSPAASMTLVGDVAQSTTPAGQERWADVFAYLATGAMAVGDVAELTIGYRVPEPILTVANRLLPLTGVDASASRSVRMEGHGPAWTHTTPAELPASVATVAAALKHHHRLTGVVAPTERHAPIAAALAAAGLQAVDHLHQLHHGEVPLFGPEQVKGLEFDGVVVVEPDEILGDTPRGARLLYVAMTRAVQALAFVTSLPERHGRAWSMLGG